MPGNAFFVEIWLKGFKAGDVTSPFLMMCLAFPLGGAMVHEEMF